MTTRTLKQSPSASTKRQNNTSNQPPAGAKPASGDDPAHPVEVVDSTPALEHWVTKISDAMSSTAYGFVQVGLALIEAKEALGHGSWSKMFTQGRLNFGLRTAETLMNLAGNTFIANPQNSAHLPVSYTSLHALAKLEPAQIQEGIEAGTIGPETSIKDAKQFAAAVMGKLPSVKKELPFNLMKRQEKIEYFLLDEVVDWPEAEQHLLVVQLRQAADDIESGKFLENLTKKTS